MKTKLLRKLRKLAIKKVYAKISSNGIDIIYNDNNIDSCRDKDYKSNSCWLAYKLRGYRRTFILDYILQEKNKRFVKRLNKNIGYKLKYDRRGIPC